MLNSMHKLTSYKSKKKIKVIKVQVLFYTQSVFNTIMFQLLQTNQVKGYLSEKKETLKNTKLSFCPIVFLSNKFATVRL